MSEQTGPRHDRAAVPDESHFDGSSIDRRTFVSLAAATGVALSLPGTVAGEEHVKDDRLSDRAEFVVNHTPDDYEATLVVEFADSNAAEAFADTFSYGRDDDRVRPAKTVTRTEPTPAGHGRLTTPEVETLLGMNGVEAIRYSPGANPFWRLDDPYKDGVFPAVEEARDYLGFEETVAGLQHLASEHPDVLNLETLGRESPGWTNLFLDEPERYPIYVAQVTNDVSDDAAFEAKEKVVYTVSIHGDEPQGREAGTRVIEDVLTGDAPAFAELLDDIALVFVFINPDGWISRETYTELPYPQGDNPSRELEFDDVNFLRGNGSFPEGSQLDTNRQYPTVGWTNPSFYPAEPEDAPDFFADLVPDALGAVEHSRGYENVEFLCDYHGMGVSDQMVLNLETNAPFDHAKTHDLDEVSIQIGEGMVGEWGDIDAIADDIAAALEEHYPQIDEGAGGQFLPGGDSYNGLLDWGTIYDTIGYQVTGAFLGWAGVPEAEGGLGAITVAPEMFHSNPFGLQFMNWKPYWARHQVTSYRISMREYARLAAADTDATVATDDTDTAYVETDALTRSSTDLPHTGGEAAADARGSTRTRTSEAPLEPGGGVARARVESLPETRSMTLQFPDAGTASGELRLRAPSGSVVRRVDLDDDAVGSHNCFLDTLYVPDPDAGSWTVEVDGDRDLDVEVMMLDSDEEIPDPREAWNGEGFEQREYEVNPLQFFADLAPYIDDDGSLDGVSVDDVRGGLEGYDRLVVSHDVATDDAEYLDVIESFVDDGGDLVLTDTGVNLLGELDVGALSSLGPDDTEDVLVNFVNLDDRDFGHPLLAGLRPRQQEMWKGPQVGYTPATDQPATVVDPDTFDAAGGETAGWIRGDADAFGVEPGEEIEGDPGVGAGTIAVGESEVTIIGSILPPAKQTELHPFGMANYALSFMGHTLLCNALGYVQRRYRDGELVRTYGSDGPPAVVGEDPPQDLDGDGLFEDIDGDGEFTLQDVQLFFQNRDLPAVQNNSRFFNFSGSDPDEVTIGDVQALFQDFIEQDE